MSALLTILFFLAEIQVLVWCAFNGMLQVAWISCGLFTLVAERVRGTITDNETDWLDVTFNMVATFLLWPVALPMVLIFEGDTDVRRTD